MIAFARTFYVLFAAFTGWGAVWCVRRDEDLVYTFSFAAVCVVSLALLTRPAVNSVEAFLIVLRRALFGATAFCGVAGWFAFRRGDVGDVTLYVLLLALCVIGLAVKPASKRTTT